MLSGAPPPKKHLQLEESFTEATGVFHSYWYVRRLLVTTQNSHKYFRVIVNKTEVN